jgi:hypothetical protein
MGGGFTTFLSFLIRGDISIHEHLFGTNIVNICSFRKIFGKKFCAIRKGADISTTTNKSIALSLKYA